MQSKEYIQLEDTSQVPTYNKIPIVFERGEGSYIWDTEGNRYLDFYGGHCVALLGHSPKPVVDAIKEQAEKLLFYSNIAYSDIRALAATRLASLAPEGLKNVFFCNSGTEANETALKLARKSTGKQGIIAMEGGFHGRTLGSLAVTGIEKYRASYKDVLPQTHFVPFGDIESVKSVLASDKNIAALILEPIQSMAGITMASNTYYHQLREVCTQNGVKLIFDEVQTGVGRIGAFTFSASVNVLPDMITMAKSLGSGVPVGAVLIADDIASTIQFGDQGTTFGGGMIAMAAVDATLKTLVEENLMHRAVIIQEKITQGLAGVSVEILGKGCLLGIQCQVPVKPLTIALRQNGIIVGGSDNPHVMRLMPPLNTPNEAVEFFIEVFINIFKQHEEQVASTI